MVVEGGSWCELRHGSSCFQYLTVELGETVNVHLATIQSRMFQFTLDDEQAQRADTIFLSRTYMQLQIGLTNS